MLFISSSTPNIAHLQERCAWVYLQDSDGPLYDKGIIYLRMHDSHDCRLIQTSYQKIGQLHAVESNLQPVYNGCLESVALLHVHKISTEKT